MNDILKTATSFIEDLFNKKNNKNEKADEEHIDEETGHYWLGLFYFVGIIIAITGIFFFLSFLTSDNNKNESISATNNNYQSQHRNDKNNDEKTQPKSKDSSELVLANVAHKILGVTGDPKTECSMPVFNSSKQYWVTNCDYNEDGEKVSSQFSINLNDVKKLETKSASTHKKEN